MIKDALQWLKGLYDESQPMIKVGGRDLIRQRAEFVPLEVVLAGLPNVQPVTTMTLSGIVELAQTLRGEALELSCLSVGGPNQVKLLGPIEEGVNRRATYGRAFFEPEVFPFDQWLDADLFVAMLRSRVSEDDVSRGIESFIYGTKHVDTREIETPGGVTIQVLTKAGLANSKWKDVPWGFQIRAHRTFTEIDQPLVVVTFRVKAVEKVGYFKLIEADGGNWQRVAIESIRDRLVELVDEAGLDLPVVA